MRSFVTLLGWLGLMAHCSAQLFDLGLKGGVNRDDLSTTYSHQPLIGGNAGVFARVKPPVLPGVQGEVLISTIGTTLRSDEISLDLRAATVQVPVFLVLAFGPVELHAGGHYNKYLTRQLAGNVEYTLDGYSVSAGDLAEDGMGLLGGAGLRLGHFYAGARYLHGLRDIGSGPVLSGVRSHQFQFYIGVGFFKAPK